MGAHAPDSLLTPLTAALSSVWRTPHVILQTHALSHFSQQLASTIIMPVTGASAVDVPVDFLTKRILTLGHQRPQSSMTWHSRAVFPNSLLLTKQWKATNCEPCCATLLYQQKAERGLTAKKGHPLGFRPPSLMQSAQLGGRNPRFRPD